MRPACEVWRLGRVPYGEAWELQNRLADERGRGGSDRLLLLEHPHTYTLGSSASEDHLLMPPEERERLGIDVFRVDRGGDITYHGPGQLVGYPILQLARDHLRTDVVGYVRKLEQVIIATLADYGVRAKPIKGLTGVWIDTPGAHSAHGEAKIAAIGVRINVRAVTKHGFALNLNPDLRYFDGIIPCGIRDKGVTSLAALLGAPVDEAEISTRLIAHFGAVFDCDMIVKQDLNGLVDFS
jgi:lipoyl(octanoyl) transferase